MKQTIKHLLPLIAAGLNPSTPLIKKVAVEDKYMPLTEEEIDKLESLSGKENKKAKKAYVKELREKYRRFSNE